MEEKSVINLEIPEPLRRKIKAHAALQGLTLSEFAAVVLQAEIDRLESVQRKEGGAQ